MGDESKVCICGHTRNYHYRFDKMYGRCQKRVTHKVGGTVYPELLSQCECQRFEEREGTGWTYESSKTK